jgi:hypothetical protein
VHRMKAVGDRDISNVQRLRREHRALNRASFLELLLTERFKRGRTKNRTGEAHATIHTDRFEMEGGLQESV